MNQKKITLDTERKSFESIVAMQGDNKSRYIEATIVNRSVQVDLTGCTVKFSAIKPDLTDIFNDAVIIDAKGGKVQIELTNQTLAVPGVIQATLVILKEDMQLSVLPFFITVIENPYNPNAIESKSEYKALNNALTVVDGYAKELQDASVNLEEKYTTRLNNFGSQLEHNVHKIGVLDDLKMNKDTKDISINQINKNKGLLDETFFTDRFKAQFIENTQPLHSTPADKSITQQKMAVPYVEGVVGKNLFNKYYVINGGYINPDSGEVVSAEGNSVGDYFIDIEPGESYAFSNCFTGAVYTADEVFIQGTANLDGWTGIPMPSNAEKLKVSVNNSKLDIAQVEKNTVVTEYEEYKIIPKTTYIEDGYITDKKFGRPYAYGKLGKNLFNKEDIKSGYIDPINGNIQPSNDNFYYEMEVRNDYYAYTDFQLGAYYDIDGNFISGSSNIIEEWNGSKIPINAKIIKVSANNSKLNTAQIEKGLNQTSYEEYGYYALNSREIKTNKIYVPSQFLAITDANNFIIDSNYYNRYEIILDNGVYKEKDLTLKPYVYIIGKDMDKTEIRGELPASATDEQITPSSTINLLHTNGLKNLTVTCKNMRYPVHDDGGGTDKERMIESCKFIHHGNDEARQYREEHGLGGTVWESENAYGSGVNSGDNFKFKNCKFIGTINAWGTHNNVGYEKSAYIEHENCEFIVTKDGSNAIGVASMGSGNTDKIVFKGCSANAPVKYFTMGTDINALEKKSEFDISGFDNNIAILNLIDNNYYIATFTDETIKLTAKENILRGQVCCYDTDMKHIRKMTQSDSKALFSGIALEDINIGNTGLIKNKGYIQDKICNISNSSFGKKYGIGEDSYLKEVAENEILIGIGYNQLKLI